jgi:hypothetical protein
MPIKQTKPRRANSAPFTYFKGKLGELEKLPPEKIVEHMEKAGATFADREAAFRWVEKLKGDARMANTGYSFNPRKNLTRLETGDGVILVLIKATKSGTILIRPHPFLHGVRSYRTPYEDLLKILQEGFFGGSHSGLTAGNVTHGINRPRTTTWGHGVTYGTGYPMVAHDKYALEMIAPITNPDKYSDLLKRAKPEQIVSVNIVLSPQATALQKKEKMQFYKKELQEKFGVPVKFITT